MQIRQSCFNRAQGCRQPECDGILHGHGYYRRYADPDGEAWLAVPRFLCARCGFTLSVLTDNLLPYRPIVAQELEAAFDRKSQPSGAAGPPAAPPSEKKSGCFDRAWTAWIRNSRQIAELYGHQLPHAASEEVAQCWSSLRKTSNIAQILVNLWRSFKTSLLKTYLCLGPGRRRGGAREAELSESTK